MTFLYVESMLNYINIIKKNGKLTVYSSLKNADALLPKDRFVRIHKSYIVAVEKINTIELKDVIINDIRLPIGRGNRNNIIDAANKLGLVFRE